VLWQSGGFRLCYRIATNSSLGRFYSLPDGGVNLPAALACLPGTAWLAGPVIAASSERRHNDLVLESLHGPVLARFPGAEFAGFASVVLVRLGYADANAVDVRIVECNVDV